MDNSDYIRLTDEQLCEHYINKTMTVTAMWKHNKISPNVLYKIFKDNNILLRGNPYIISDTLIEKLKNEYEHDGISLLELCKKYKIGKSSLSKYFKLKNVDIIPLNQFVKKYEINDNIFSIIDSPEKSQILGLIYADGTLSSTNKLIAIRLEEQDSNYLDMIRLYIGSTKPLYYIKPRSMISPCNNKQYTTFKRTVSLDITNKKIYEDCARVGLCPRKTYKNLGIPVIDRSLYNSFVLGLFEGDGCVSYHINKKSNKLHSCYFSIACQEKMAHDLQKIIYEELDIHAHVYKNPHVYNFTILKKMDIVKLFNWLYTDCSFKMERKFNKFTQLISHF